LFCFETIRIFAKHLNEKFMEKELSQKQIGLRVMTLRKKKGLTQEELAGRIGLSRTSLTQIETGNRSLTVIELHKIAAILSISLDEFLYAGDSGVTEASAPENIPSETKPDNRISVPELNVEKLKNILLYILERCAGKPNVGETILYILLYFCDFNYYELYEEHLSGIRYKKLPYGPVPQNLDGILQQMVEARLLKQVNTEYHKFKQTRYLPLEKADLQQFSAAEKEVIDNVIMYMGDWTVSKMNEYIYMDLPWNATEVGDYISCNLAFYRRPPFSVRIYQDEEV